MRFTNSGNLRNDSLSVAFRLQNRLLSSIAGEAENNELKSDNDQQYRPRSRRHRHPRRPPPPKGGRVSIGVVLGRDGVAVVQSREGTDALEQAAFVRYPSGLGAALDDRARFASNLIRSIVEKPSDCDI